MGVRAGDDHRLARLNDLGGLTVIRSRAGRNAERRDRDAGHEGDDRDLQVGTAIRRVNGVVRLSLPDDCASSVCKEIYAPVCLKMVSRFPQNGFLLKRGAILRYKRLVGLSPVEFGLVASLGRRPPMSVIGLAEAVGMDKGQISRALAELVSRRLVAKEINPRDNRETLVCLTKAGLAAHDTIVAGAHERNRRLLEQLGKEELAGLLDQIDRLTETAAVMLADEKDQALDRGRSGWRGRRQARQERNTFSGSASAPTAGRDVGMACLAPSVALR